MLEAQLRRRRMEKNESKNEEDDQMRKSVTKRKSSPLFTGGTTGTTDGGRLLLGEMHSPFHHIMHNRGRGTRRSRKTSKRATWVRPRRKATRKKEEGKSVNVCTSYLCKAFLSVKSWSSALFPVTRNTCPPRRLSKKVVPSDLHRPLPKALSCALCMLDWRCTASDAPGLPTL